MTLRYRLNGSGWGPLATMGEIRPPLATLR